MLSLTGTGQVFLATGVTDMRQGFNGLYALVQHTLGGDPLSGTIYGFCNRRRDMLKLLFFHDGGLWVCAKRLEAGTFRWPEAGERVVQYTAAQLHLLLSREEVVWTTQAQPRWARGPTAAPDCVSGVIGA